MPDPIRYGFGESIPLPEHFIPMETDPEEVRLRIIVEVDGVVLGYGRGSLRKDAARDSAIDAAHLVVAQTWEGIRDRVEDAVRAACATP